MQNRTRINSTGPSGVLQADALEFWEDYTGPKLNREADICALIELATNPRCVLPAVIRQGHCQPGEVSAWTFAALYAQAPDFVLKFLAAMRRRYFKNSKRQRIQNFLATADLCFRTHAPIVKAKTPSSRFITTTSGHRVKIVEEFVGGHATGTGEFYGKELAETYNVQVGAKHGETATEDDIEQARKALAARFAKGEKLSTKLNRQNAFKV